MSLLDYTWRREIFKSERASQAESSTLSKMSGSTQLETPIIRPMSLSTELSELGPLGSSVAKAVSWLEDVMDSEARRAQAIVDGGDPVNSLGLVRPMNVSGPLGEIEEKAVGMLEEIKESERLRFEMVREREGGNGGRGEGEDKEFGGENYTRTFSK